MNIDKEIKKKTGRLYYILHEDEVNERQVVYDNLHKEEKIVRDREYHAVNRAKELRGLCHLCYCSNQPIVYQKGQIICESCAEDQND